MPAESYLFPPVFRGPGDDPKKFAVEYLQWWNVNRLLRQELPNVFELLIVLTESAFPYRSPPYIWYMLYKPELPQPTDADVDAFAQKLVKELLTEYAYLILNPLQYLTSVRLEPFDDVEVFAAEFALSFQESGKPDAFGVELLLDAMRTHPVLFDAVMPSCAHEIASKSARVGELLKRTKLVHRLLKDVPSRADASQICADQRFVPEAEISSWQQFAMLCSPPAHRGGESSVAFLCPPVYADAVPAGAEAPSAEPRLPRDEMVPTQVLNSSKQKQKQKQQFPVHPPCGRSHDPNALCYGVKSFGTV